MFSKQLRRISKVIIAFILTLPLFYSSIQAHAAEFSLFNKVYIRQQGKPVTVTDSFSALVPGASYTLRLVNGPHGRHGEDKGEITVTLNGIRILKNFEFKKGVSVKELQVTLKAVNQISVIQDGKPQSRITLSVVGNDSVAPVAAWLLPAVNAHFDVGPVPAKLSLKDNYSGIDPASLAILLDGVSVRGSFPALTGPTLDEALPADLTVARGVHTLSTNVKDKAGNQASSASVSFTVNRQPVANAGAGQTLDNGQIVTLDGSASSDPDGDALTYVWSFVSRPTGSASALSNPTAQKPVFTLDKVGSFELQLIVNDGLVDSAPAAVVVVSRNRLPVANAGTDQALDNGQTVTLDGSASVDADGDSLAYRWTIISKPDGSAATLSDPAAQKPAFILDKKGDYVLSLVVNDGVADSLRDDVTVVSKNRPPLSNAGAGQTLEVGEAVILDGSASSDADSDSLTYQWSFVFKPAGSTVAFLDPAAEKPSFTPDQVGDYQIQLVVNDGTVDSDPTTVLVTATPSTAPLTAVITQVHNDVTGSVVTVDGSASTGGTLTYAWSLISKPENSLSVIEDPATTSTSFMPDMDGDYVVQLVVNNGRRNSAPVTMSFSTE